MSLNEFKQLVLDLNRMCKNPPTLIFTGGEPLTTDITLELARFAKNKGNNLGLLTNGTLINENNAQKIADLFNVIQISIDGTTSKIHDEQRGKGSFQATTKAIGLLQKNKANLILASTVTSKSIKEAPLLARKYGKLLKFAPFFPNIGRAKFNSKFAISGVQYYKALTSDECINPMGRASYELNKMKGHRIYRCSMGHEQVSIDSDGSVYPCHLLHEKKFFAGNVRETPIAQIYDESDVLKYVRKLNVESVSGCKKCSVRYLCAGACRGRAYLDSGSLKVSGKFCDYEFNSIIDGLFKNCRKIEMN